MRQTYELYLEDDSGERSFETLLCGSLTEVMPQVRELIAARNLAAVEVHMGGQHLFTVAR